MSPERVIEDVVDHLVEAPYVHATGPMLSHFLTALRDERAIYGARCERCGKVVVPPAGHCDVCGGALGDLVCVGPGGVVVGLTIVSVAAEGVTESTGSTAPFAYVRVRLDGADTDLVHLARDTSGIARGVRVRAVWAAERSGTIHDIAGFELEIVRPPSSVLEPAAAPAPDAVTAVRARLALSYRLAIGDVERRFRARLLGGELSGNRCGRCASVYVPPRPFCPRCFVACGDWRVLPDTGTVTAFVIVNVPFSGQEIEIPYVLGHIQIDGADATFYHLVGVIGPRGKLVAPPDGARAGMRVRAAWRPDADRRGLLNDDIDHFEPMPG